jgi:hypothetical protein
VQHDDEGWRCLVACLFPAIRERLLAAITAVVNPSRRPETQAADRSPRPGFVPSADAWAHEPGAGWLAPHTCHSVCRITCVNLVAAHENFIR